MSLVTTFTDAIYGVPSKRAAWDRLHPEDPSLSGTATKAVRGQEAMIREKGGTWTVERGPAWITSRRAVLIVRPGGLRCGDWEIPLASITSAKILHIPSILAKSVVLEVTTDQEFYTFGLTPPPDLLPSLPFPVTELHGRMGWSLPSLLLRLLLLAYFAWLIYRQL